MIRIALYCSILSGFLLFGGGCDKKEKKSESVVWNEEKGTADTAQKTALTKIRFDSTEFDFGKIREGEVVSHVFKFTNIGSAPLVISGARASCGCTVPEWTKDPVMPGQEGSLEVKFNSTGKQDKFRKQITVTANTEPAESLLFITGEVLKVEKK